LAQIFFLDFYVFFSSISSFCFKLFALELYHFVTLFGYFKSRLVKLTRVSLFFLCFLLNFGFFTRFSFWNSLFIMVSYCGLWVRQVRPSHSVFLLRCYISFIFFVFIFNMRLIDLELYDFISLSFLRGVSVSYSRSHFTKCNLICLRLSSPEYLFSIKKS
jgi:hypothetical protein